MLACGRALTQGSTGPLEFTLQTAQKWRLAHFSFASIPLRSVHYRAIARLGSGIFLPGGRPPVNVSRKGGRSPKGRRRLCFARPYQIEE
jgi:hypothetical protein